MERINPRNLPVKTLVLGALFMLALINVVSAVAVFSKLGDSSAAVDVASRNRMLSQRMVLFARLYLDGDQSARGISRSAMELHDLSVLALKHGGEAPKMENKILSPASGASLDYLKRVEDLWQNYKIQMMIVLEEPTYLDSTATTEETATDSLTIAAAPRLIRVPNPKVKASFDYLGNNASYLLELNDGLVKTYVAQARDQERTVYTLLVTGLIGTLLLLAVGYQTLNQVLFKPLGTMTKAAQLIAQGDYHQHLEYQGKNELALMTASLNTLFDKFRKASWFVSEFGKGNYAYQPEEFTRDDSFVKDSFIASLVETQRVLKESDAENKRRNWTNEGFARFSDMLRKTDEGFEQLGRKLIMELTDYLEINQGGLFILNDADTHKPYLELVACYAYNREKYLEKRIEAGEGLVGEVFLEGMTKYMKVIPKNYIHINSGLGSATPGSLLIVPLKLNDQVMGVIELASFTEFEAYKIEFIEKLGESIAATIATARTSEVTRHLYEQAQLQAEQMRAQEEEMRQNMEELQATQEEMYRKEREYVARIAELEEKVMN